MDDRRTRHDAYYRRAKEQGYAARSVYKLEQLDQRFQLFRRRKRVLDLGCRPGSWLQYAASRVGPSGCVVGVDRSELDIAMPNNVRVVVGDVTAIDPKILRGDLSCFQLILSDMAPDTSGVSFTDQVRSVDLFEHALAIATQIGCPGAAFVAKLLMGAGSEEALAQAKRCFERSKNVRPDATRKRSTEVYFVGIGLKQTRPRRQ